MRVALVCPYDLSVPGGVQAHVRDLAASLRELGDEVVIVGPMGEERGGRVHGVGGTVSVPFNDSRAPISLSPLAARRALEAVERHEPDVVHVHEPAVPTISLAVSLWGPRPVVATFHAWSDEDVAYRLARPLIRKAIAGVSENIAVSQPAAAYHAEALGLPTSRFHVVPNGVDVSRFADAEARADLTADEPTLLFVGRLERRKGLDQLLRAFVQLKTTHPDLRLLVVGDGPERDDCEALLPAQLRADVHFQGRVDVEQLPRFHASSDIFVAPALGGESFGIVLVEAMAAGLPVVASSLPGYRSVVTDGVNGLLVPPGQPRALAESIGSLLDNPSRGRALAQEGRATAADHDWSVVTARIRDVYAETLRSTSTRGARRDD